MEQINVEEIMRQIRAEIKEKGYREEMVDFEEIPICSSPGENSSVSDGLGNLIGQIKNASFIAWRRPVPSGIKGLIKKIIQKCIGFTVAPITEDQTNYNSIVHRTFEQLHRQLQSQQEQMEELRQRIQILENEK